MTNRSQSVPPQHAQECRENPYLTQGSTSEGPACLPGVSCVFQDARGWANCGSQVLPLLSTANSQWDVVWHKLSPETRAAFPRYQSADGHQRCLGQPGLVRQCFGVSALWFAWRGMQGLEFSSSCASRRDSWRHLLTCFHSPSECWEDQCAAPPPACSALGTGWIHLISFCRSHMVWQRGQGQKREGRKPWRGEGHVHKEHMEPSSWLRT